MPLLYLIGLNTSRDFPATDHSRIPWLWAEVDLFQKLAPKLETFYESNDKKIKKTFKPNNKVNYKKCWKQYIISNHRKTLQSMFAPLCPKNAHLIHTNKCIWMGGKAYVYDSAPKIPFITADRRVEVSGMRKQYLETWVKYKKQKQKKQKQKKQKQKKPALYRQYIDLNILPPLQPQSTITSSPSTSTTTSLSSRRSSFSLSSTISPTTSKQPHNVVLPGIIPFPGKRGVKRSLSVKRENQRKKKRKKAFF